MVTTHNLGFPRIGAFRELKFAQEKFWRGETDAQQLQQVGRNIRAENWLRQDLVDWLPVGDFSLYDQVLDTSFLLGNIPQRVAELDGDELASYFRVARGRSAGDSDCQCVHAGEMTKWFDTNYHYIVPEVTSSTQFALNAGRLLSQINEAKSLGKAIKPVIIGPVTYLGLCKAKDNSNPLDLLDQLIPIYGQLLVELAEAGATWVQIDEPLLVTELNHEWQQAYERAYHVLKSSPCKLLLATYFGELQENLRLVCNLPVAGVHIDAISAAHEVPKVIDWLPEHKVLSLGVISGRNIWKTDLNKTLDTLEPIHERLKDRLWLAPSCSLLHVPVDLTNEQQLDPELKQWLAFAVQKIEELTLLQKALNYGRESVATELQNNRHAVYNRQHSARIHNPKVQLAIAQVNDQDGTRQSAFSERSAVQRSRLKLPAFPTTTIGSFPQTNDIRQTRAAFKRGDLPETDYQQRIKAEIAHCIEQQEALELDVLVHGEAERNDMVEYFGEQLEGFAFSQFGWVQSYGSRCVKPPILFGDVSRPKPMTVAWIQYAQSLTHKPVKGMLTGPVTILNWSFVRDDQPRSTTCLQLALAVREEVLDLEKAGIAIIQIDEAALREGLPLRKAQWQHYLDWAVHAFRVCANGVADSTQIHTHMCYSEFNDIIESIAAMDADVITIETSRSDMELLDAFETFEYPNDIGPGVYDIHSPNVPAQAQIVKLMQRAAERIPAERLWVNPDCGLKTRHWEEVIPALQHMVTAAKALRIAD